PVSPRLADLVRGHVDGGPLPVDPAPAVEAAAQRPGRARPAGHQSLPRRPAALGARPALPLRVRAPGDPSGAWWKRTPLGLWIVPLSADDPRLRRFLAM